MAETRKASRYVVPFAVAGVAAATIGLVPALAASGDPDLPEITAQQLIEKIAASDTQTLSGTFKVTTDLGLPSVAGLADSFMDGAASGAAGGGTPSTDPTEMLTKLISGSHTLRVAADGPDRQKLTILDGSDEYSLIHNGDDVWAYDSKSNEVFHEKGASSEGPAGEKADKELPGTPKELADEVLKAAGDTTSITVGGTATVAGRDAYQLVIKPKQSGSTVDSVKIAVDAKTGTPLKFTLASVEGGKPVIDAGFTKVDFGKPAASTFDFKAPKGAKVTEGLNEDGEPEHRKAPKDVEKDLEKEFGGLDGLFGGAMPGASSDGQGMNVIGEGWTTIATYDTGAKAPKTDEAPKEVQGFLDSLGDEVNGKFGSGTVFKTKIVNALMTDDGKVYVGAVTKQALVDAANAAK
ncbi:sigma-E factor regulatory protein RseB domain-containing protein [Streptomyces sp. P9(2023)]|uniref:LolA family protein n=1 Tax=Streptomyces sp. P9(2023) TaxID=3064394 RepID=UPI0028F40ED4|nr:sigma-E factor regulatory protein RseB domain-containing protein [Streptomyces sp. P9(2023)]MDT9690613.1 sigma-E factor regulatory protein RseB domain-containing protein [Streptomyces sp. P9(2023)]